MNEMSSADSAEATLIITEAVERFRDSVSPDDRAQIESTEPKDVLNALFSIQKDLQQRRENRNLRKLHPFVQGLERYSGAIDTLSNGLSPYLPWIWAPIKLMLQVTTDYLNAFDRLIDAYGRIAETMPRLKNLSDTFKDNPTLLTKLALYYADVLEFHRRAYKFVRRRSWKFFFNTTWANFDFRFNSILASMARQSEAIDQEAATIDIIEAKQWREKLASQVTTREKDRIGRQRQSVIAWLALEHLPQDDNREKLLRDCLPGSCDWVLKQEKVASWVRIDSRLPVVWLHGKPGAGKSVICASLIDLLEDSGITTFSYFCKYHQSDTPSQILKTLVLKIIESSPDFSTIAFTEFVQKYREPSLKILRTMLTGAEDKQGFLHGIQTCRLVIDGLDECDKEEQKYIVEDLLQLVSVNSKGGNCKLLISSRDVPEISRAVRKKKRNVGMISLSNERASLDHTIQLFVENRLRDLVNDRESFQIGEKVIEDIVNIMINKADGMFLWAKLVLDSISEVDSVRELHAAITSMPRELPQLYARILKALVRDGRTDKVMRVLAWLALAKRPLQRHELLHGLSITPETPTLNEWDVLDGSIIDKCKPLVEELPDGSIALIHFTVEEYLRTDCSTQRLNCAIGEEAIAFACVTVLKDSLCLLDPEFPKLNQLLGILSGSFALLFYAIDFWLDHVLVCASSAHLPEESSLGRALTSLENLHNQLSSRLKPNGPEKASPRAPVSTDNRLETLSHLSVYSLCASILQLRADCKDESASNGQEFEELALERDSTLFSTLSVRFRESVGQLLSEYFINNDISQDQLDCFRKQYLRYSFRCRFAPCTRASLGFASEALRASHEQLHVKRLFCDKPNCSGGRIGFRRQKDLDIHNRTYHEQGSILVPPRVRRAFKAHTEGNEPSATPSNNGGMFSTGHNDESTLPAAAQQNAAKYRELLPFNADGIKEALSKQKESRSRREKFIVLLNEKFKSSLDVNLIHTLKHSNSVTCCVDISPDDGLIATGGDKLARVFDAGSGEEKFRFKIDGEGIDDRNYVQAVQFSNNGRYLATGLEGGRLILWQLQGLGRQLKVFEGHEKEIYGLAIAPDGYTAITCGGDKTARVWDLRDETNSKPRSIIYARGVLIDVAISPDSQLVAAGCVDNSVYLWSIRTGDLQRKFSAHTDCIYSVRFSPDGQTLISASLDRSIMTWEIDLANPQKYDSPQPLKQMKLHQDFVFYSLMTTNGRWILSSSKDCSVIFWDAETGDPHLVLLAHTDHVLQLAVGHSSRIFVTASADKTAKVWSYSA